MKKYDIKNIYSTHSLVPRPIADYSLISAILVSMSLMKDLSELSYLFQHNKDKAEEVLTQIDQDFAQSISIQGPWIIDTDGYHNARQGHYVYANLIYTLQHFDTLMIESCARTVFSNQPLYSKLLWHSHSKMVSDPMIYPNFLKLITTHKY